MAKQFDKITAPAGWPDGAAPFTVTHPPDHEHAAGEVVDCLSKSAVVCECADPCPHELKDCCGWLVKQGYAEPATKAVA